jgi:glycosyltransferase involved in cell wall biosynthesis
LSSIKGSLLLYAPNVHTGGGFVLLQSLLRSWPADLPFVAWLDIRARDRLDLPINSKVEWVRPSFVSRIKSEFTLANLATSEHSILCFHGLPPLLRNKARVVIFQQNRNYLGLVELNTFAWRTRQRLRFEQSVAYFFRERCNEYWVQTPSMFLAIKRWYGDKPVRVRVMPFTEPLGFIESDNKKKWDFLYVADGEAHKNHRRLIEAWVNLAQQGIRPSLALTLSSRDSLLQSWVQHEIKTHALQIRNLGQLPHEQMLSLYGQAMALIFPSVSESFGLPLIEARQAGLPILASELDFVRDVCEPVQTFDPNSATSIARAVKRFMGHADLPLHPAGAAEFLSAVLASQD